MSYAVKADRYKFLHADMVRYLMNFRRYDLLIAIDDDQLAAFRSKARDRTEKVTM